MRRPLMAGNWKMFLDIPGAGKLAEELVSGTKNVTDRDILVCPSFPLLSRVAQAVEGSAVQLGAQNLYYEESGVFTGEVSAAMLRSVPCSYVIVGHSERRHVFGESDELVGKKVASALKQGLRVILCVGELLEEREEGNTKRVVKRQIERGLDGVEEAALEDVVVAYEPVWAIGTGKTATPKDADNVHAYIRTVLSTKFSKTAASEMRILYGGSVKPENVDGLMAKANIDGALVGGASLKSESFLRIIKFET
ncbi:MAG: triose-phosphate isomerase [Spirochaetes bacterium]|nr:triose-phosphate isomerase [Spirochaetota bacterium]